MKCECFQNIQFTLFRNDYQLQLFMILLKRFQNPLFLKKFLAPGPLAATSSVIKNYNNPLTQLSIEKVLTLSSNKKCDSAEDAKLYAYIFEAFSKARNVNTKIQASMDKQAERLLINLLNYLPNLPVNQTFFVANQTLESFFSKKINLKQELIDNFVQLVNKNISLFLKEEKNQNWNQNIMGYIQKIVLMKKPAYHTKQILQFLILNAKTDYEVVQILKLFILIKYKSPMPIQVLLQQLLQDKIGAKTKDIPLNSPLIDEIVLQLFIQFRLYIKKPYNCLPPWLMIIVQKLTQKYMNPEYNVSTLKKMVFLKFYCKLLTETIPIAEANLFLPHHFHNFVIFFHNISQQVLDYVDNQDLIQKVQNYINCVKFYKLFLRKAPYYQSMDHLLLLEEIYQKIFNRFILDIDFSRVDEEKQQQICELISNLSYSLVQINNQQRNKLSKRLLLNAYEKQVQTFIHLSKKYEKNYDKFFYIFPLLNPIALLYKQLTQKYSSILLSSSKINNYQAQVIQRINKVINQTNEKVILEYYQVSKENKISQDFLFVDFVGICYLFTLFTDKPVSAKLQQTYRLVKVNNLSAVIDNVSDSPLLTKQAVQKQFTKVYEETLHRVNKYFSSQHLPAHQMKQRSPSKYKFKSYEDQICNNTLMLFKSGPANISGLISPMYTYWFIQNASTVEKMFSIQTPFGSPAWYSLRTLIRYVHTIIYKSAIDLAAQIIRISILGCKDQNNYNLICKKINELFLDRNVQSLLRKKFDDFADLKYSFMMSLFIDYNTSAYRIQKQAKNYRKKKEKFGVNSQGKNRVRKQINGQKQNGQNEQDDNLSLILQVQLVQFCATQLKRPLQFNNYRSKFICESINEYIQKIYSCAQETVKFHPSSEIIWQRRKQNVIANSPIQHIIYLFCLQNYISPIPIKNNFKDKKQEWFQSICLSSLMYHIKRKYNRVSIYNLLLAFDMNEVKNKKVHDAFLSEQLQLQYQANMAAEKDRQDIQLQSTTYKFYYYLLSPRLSKEAVGRHASDLLNSAKMKDAQVIQYWVNKNIVLKTVDEKLVDVMLMRLMECREVTYMQYCTALNTIITLVSSDKLKDYHYSETKKAKLKAWVHSHLDMFAVQKADDYLQDYLMLRNYFGKNKNIQSQLPQLIDNQLSANNLYLLETLFSQKHKLAHSSMKELKDMLTRGKQRCILKDYYRMAQSCMFRVEFVLMRIYGLILMQNQADLLRWFNEDILAHVDVTNIQDYLRNPSNKQQLRSVIIRQKISQHLLNHKFESALHGLLDKLSSQFGQQMEVSISIQQKTRSQSTRWKQAPFVRIGSSKMLLVKQNDRKQYTYLTANEQLTAEQILQLEYIKVFDGSILLEVRVAA